MKPLDFLIIGAQKCATTTLFEHLRSHPDIAMPLEKEVPFFTGDDCSAENWQAFAQDKFGPEQNEKLWGKATPQYMSDPNAAARIHKLMPDTKLVAILRDPMQRTWSHFRMGQRRDTEQREFSEAIASLLSNTEPKEGQELVLPDHANGYESEADFYVAWSEYGRILKKFSACFSPQQLLVLYTEDLENDPAATLDRLLAFIGLPVGFRPPTLGEVIHRGGASNRVPNSVRSWLRDRGLLYRLWQLLPDAHRGRLRFQYEQWNVRKSGDPMSLPDHLSDQLRKHYGEDIQSLLSLSVDPPPWVDRYLPYN
ncbi:sulfotransferase [Halieaceae bacterium IMCC14734]|uniref:Sulfotransferase n=1 Tax=Candidatus Litorirhabdus singularis TaxID=2518993 RepID=A0ABT3TE56_9GAMM|nr:sulfotransferase [Candidatus Litorirhabdus singularis]MCX2980593.1 sulfotransferase [Candidatus Litorirhabdus singularis]